MLDKPMVRDIRLIRSGTGRRELAAEEMVVGQNLAI